MTKINVDLLSKEDRAQLLEQLKADEALAKLKKKQDRDAYKESKEEWVASMYPLLESISTGISGVKKTIFESVDTLIAMSTDVYGVKPDQNTYTFTDNLGRSIIVGVYEVDKYDDTVHAGIAKVKEFVKSLASSEETGVLVDTVLSLLRMDKEGNLKPSRVMELNKVCNKLENPPLLVDGLEIINAAHKTAKTCTFVKVSFKDEQGITKSLPLSMSAVG